MSSELEELRSALEAAERGRKHAESELNEANDRVNELSTQNASLGAHKRRLEGDCQAMQVSAPLSMHLISGGTLLDVAHRLFSKVSCSLVLLFYKYVPRELDLNGRYLRWMACWLVK